jgi:hypothetical protein
MDSAFWSLACRCRYAAVARQHLIVRPLANTLVVEELVVWYDEFELCIGDRLFRKIDRGLAKSGVRLVVLSHAFIDKEWTDYELDGIITRKVDGQQILLPIWHNISKVVQRHLALGRVPGELGR